MKAKLSLYRLSSLLIALAFTLFLTSFGCGGGGGGGGGDDDSGPIPGRDAPEVTSAIMFRANDPEETPIMTAEVGEELYMLFCFCDPNADVGYGTISLWYPPPNDNKPFYVENSFIDQEETEICECWYWASWIITPPIGEYHIRVEVRDDVLNWSLPFDIEPFVVTQTNTNFDYLTEEPPEKKLWKEE